jgi:hypothetical protein
MIFPLATFFYPVIPSFAVPITKGKMSTRKAKNMLSLQKRKKNEKKRT